MSNIKIHSTASSSGQYILGKLDDEKIPFYELFKSIEVELLLDNSPNVSDSHLPGVKTQKKKITLITEYHVLDVAQMLLAQ